MFWRLEAWRDQPIARGGLWIEVTNLMVGSWLADLRLGVCRDRPNGQFIGVLAGGLRITGIDPDWRSAEFNPMDELLFEEGSRIAGIGGGDFVS